MKLPTTILTLVGLANAYQLDTNTACLSCVAASTNFCMYTDIDKFGKGYCCDGNVGDGD
jgi:hypothetical protein